MGVIEGRGYTNLSDGKGQGCGQGQIANAGFVVILKVLAAIVTMGTGDVAQQGSLVIATLPFSKDETMSIMGILAFHAIAELVIPGRPAFRVGLGMAARCSRTREKQISQAIRNQKRTRRRSPNAARLGPAADRRRGC